MPHDITTSFFLAVGIALFAYYLVKLTRGFKSMQQRLIDGIKPWACNVCMSFWTTALLTLLIAGLSWCIIDPKVVNWWLLVPWLPSMGLCTFMLEWTPDRPIDIKELP